MGDTVNASRRTFVHRGIELSFLEAGPETAEAILLLHGFPDEATMWWPVLSRLAADGHRVIAPDTVGCGQSGMAPHRYDYGALQVVSDHVALLDHLGVDRVHVVGHDWGSVIAWFLAVYHPDRLRSLVAVSLGHPTAYAHAGLSQKRAGWYIGVFCAAGLAERVLLERSPLGLSHVFGSHPDIDEVLDRLGKPGRLTAAVRLYRANLLQVLMQRHPAVKAPTLGIWSSGDPFVVECQMTDSATYVDGPWRYVHLDGGHWIPIDQPELLTDLVLEHVAKA